MEERCAAIIAPFAKSVILTSDVILTVRFSVAGDITDPATGEKCIVMEGKPIGTPSAINVTTLTYAYTWE